MTHEQIIKSALADCFSAAEVIYTNKIVFDAAPIGEPFRHPDLMYYCVSAY